MDDIYGCHFSLTLCWPESRDVFMLVDTTGCKFSYRWHTDQPRRFTWNLSCSW